MKSQVKKWKAEPMKNKSISSEVKRFKKDVSATGLPKVMR